jgi:hypothetical protein
VRHRAEFAYRYVFFAISIAALTVTGWNLVRLQNYLIQLVAVRRGDFRALQPSRSSSTIPVPGRVQFETLTEQGNPSGVFSFPTGNAIILVSDTRCSACNQNMPRWLDLLVQLKREKTAIPVFVVSLDTSFVAFTKYWSTLKNEVTLVLPADRSVVKRTLDVRGTPTTLVLRNGQIATSFLGALSHRRRQYLINLLRN